MKPLRKILLTVIGILPFFTPVDIAKADTADTKSETESRAEKLFSGENESAPWHKARFSLEAQTGSRSIGTLDAFVPFLGGDDFMVYADVMAKYGTGSQNANGNTFEGNAGLGIRRVNDDETAIYGIYAFYDTLRSVNDNIYKQATVGVERLGMTWDFRANVYMPFGQTQYTDTNYTGGHIEGNDIIEYVQTQTEYAHSGFDVEVGRTLGSDKLRGYFAMYSFGSNLTGPRIRAEYKLNQHISFNATIQHDQTRGAQYFLGAQFSIGGAKSSSNDSIYYRMTDNVVRDVDVVTSQHITDETVVEKDKYFIVDPSSQGQWQDGSNEHPYQSLEAALNAAPEGAFVVLKGDGNHTYDLGGKTIQLKPGQVLTSDQTDLVYKNIMLVKGHNDRPNIQNGTIALSDDVTIQHFDFYGADDLAAALIVDANKNVNLSDVTISGYQTGLKVTGESSVSLNGFLATNNTIGIEQTGGEITARGSLDVSENRQVGLAIEEGAVFNGESVTADRNGDAGVTVDGGTFNLSGDLEATNTTTGLALNKGVVNIQGNANVQGNAKGIEAQSSQMSVGSIQADQSNTNALKLTNTNLIVTGDIHAANAGGNAIDMQGGSLLADTIYANGANGSGLHGVMATIDLGNTLDVSGSKDSGLDLTDSKLNAARDINVSGSTTGLVLLNTDVIVNGNIDASDTLSTGIYLDGANTNLTANTITANNNVNDNIVVNNATLTAESVTANSSKVGNGIRVEGSAASVNINKAVASNNILSGIVLEHDARATIGAGSEVNNNSVSGVNIIQGHFTGINAVINNNAQNGVTLTEGDLNLSGTTLDGNVDNGILMSGDSTLSRVATLDNTTVINTKANESGISSGSGVGINVANNSDVTLTGTNTIENSDGIGMWLQAGNLQGDTLRIINAGHAAYTSSDSVYYHSGLVIDGQNDLENAPTVTDLSNLTVVDANGFGIYLNQGMATIEQANIEFNLVRVPTSGIKMNDGYLTINSGKILGAERVGVDLQGSGTLSLSNMEISNKSGAGLSAAENSTLNISNSLIHDNLGSGLSVDGNAKVTVLNTEIYNNHDNGININKNGSVTLTNSKVHDNTGYGIYMHTGKFDMEGDKNNMDSSSIYNNGKGGFYLEKVSADALSFNSVEDYNQYIEEIKNSEVNIHNTLIKNNKGYGIYSDADYYSYSIFGNGQHYYLKHNISNVILQGNHNQDGSNAGMYIPGIVDNKKGWDLVNIVNLQIDDGYSKYTPDIRNTL